MDKLITIVGLTSSGKSGLGIELAKRFNGEIVSADSRQVYIGLDWCSGKVTKQELAEVPHHLIDVCKLGTQFSLFDFQKMAYNEIDKIIKSNKVPFLVGGTGLYSRAIVEGYNLSDEKPNGKLREELSNKTIEELICICKEKEIDYSGEQTCRRLIRLIEKNNFSSENKPRYDVLQIGIKWDRFEIYERIRKRLEMRMPHMIEEIKRLLYVGESKEFLMTLGLEAKNIILYLDGKFDSYDDFFETLFKEERHFAKRQQTWYNKEKNIVWLDAKDDLLENASKLVKEFLNK